MNRKILALGIVITLIAGFVACKALTKTTENTPTSEPTVQTVQEEDTTPQVETTYDFDTYTNQYKSDMGVTDEELLGNESLKGALYEWLRDGNISYEQAQRDKEAGCDNVLLDDYLAWLSGNNSAGETTNETTNTTDNSTNQSTDTSTGANNTTSSGGVSSALNSDKYLTEDGRVNLDALEADGLFDASEGIEGGSWRTEEDIRASEEAGKGMHEYAASGQASANIKEFLERNGLG